MTSENCRYFEICSGCSYAQSEKLKEQQDKRSHLKGLVESLGFNIEFQYQDFATSSRNRLDFVIENSARGLWSHRENAILDLESCQVLEPSLQKYYEQFRQISWPIKKGSFRLRTGVDGIKGAWLDFANLDVKQLLESRAALESLKNISDVTEIGQRFKVLFEGDDGFKLGESELHPWWSSLYLGKEIPLWCAIGAFTQPSREANLWILNRLRSWVHDYSPSSILELGAGIGNMTVALSDLVNEYNAIENHKPNLTALEFNLQKLGIGNVSIHDQDFHRTFEYPKSDLTLVNPGRAGVGDSMNSLVAHSGSKTFVYMSCFPESWAKDSLALKSSGFQLKELWLVNQFPLSKHYEILSVFERP